MFVINVFPAPEEPVIEIMGCFAEIELPPWLK